MSVVRNGKKNITLLSAATNQHDTQSLETNRNIKKGDGQAKEGDGCTDG